MEMFGGKSDGVDILRSTEAIAVPRATSDVRFSIGKQAASSFHISKFSSKITNLANLA